MRKIILLLIALTHLSCDSHSQDGVIFKVQYKPETKYNNIIEQTSLTEIKYSGSDDFMKKLKDKGIQNPTVTTTQSKFETVFKTGKLTDGINFPLTIEFAKTTSSDGKKIVPDGTLIYGHGSNVSMPTLDSIVSNGLDESFKKTLLQSTQSMFSQLSFPKKQVKIGESFSRESPLTIPIAGVTIDMTITITYKLLNIIKGVADFDVSSVYSMKTAISKNTIKATGSGKGKLLYDIAKDYYTKYETDTEMKMYVKLDNFDLELNSKSCFKLATVITSN